ncbi:hypothetical protein GCM10017691_61180 [Pseudonocardia petroleophila]
MRELRAGEPHTIGPYRLVGVIGAGGMGQVFLGVAPDGRLAAVKQVLAGFADDPGFRARFAREVDASRRVSGAYTAPVLDADPHAHTPWLASVYVPGPSLQQAVTTHGPLPETTLRRLGVGLVTALAEIHRAGLIHRDLKPGNVLLTDDGPRVIDFGIAHALHDSAPLTRTGAVIGSPGYLSPEQLDDLPLTPASDVFALGAVLAYAAGGQAPFGTGTPQAMLYRVVAADPDLTPVPPALRPLLAACLAKHPAQRPTIAQLREAMGRLEPTHTWLPPALHAMVADQATAARRLAGLAPAPPATPPPPAAGPGAHGPHGVAPPPHPTSPPAAGRRRGRVIAAAGLAAVAVVAAVVGLVAFLPRPGTTPAAGDGAEQGLSAPDAAALVTDLLPDPETPPPGFRLVDDPGTPEIDGVTADPLAIDRSRTYFACEVQADPPTPAEAGVTAVSGVRFVEDTDMAAGRFRDYRFVTVAHLAPGSRDQIMREIRGRIGDCRTDIPPGFTDWRFTDNTVTGADETVGYIANQEPDATFPEFPTRVGACDFARVGAVVIRACTLISNTPNALGATSTLAQDDTLRARNREILEPLVARARELRTG